MKGLHKLPPRALASIVRALIRPIEALLQDGQYRPFVSIFSRACDAAAPWYELGQDPQSVDGLELDAVEMRGSREERQLWSTLWSASRCMEFARTGDIAAAHAQFRHTLELIRDWSRIQTMAGPSQQLLQHATEYVDHVLESLSDGDDPPLDSDALAMPAFYTRSSAHVPQPPANPNAHPLDFGREKDRLAQLLRDGRVAVFCGAGISIDSGIPSALELRGAVLELLPASDRERRWLRDADIPFEAFLEDVNVHSALGPLLDLFKKGDPNAAHRFLAELTSCGLLRTIATTNFDELIERALADRAVPFDPVWKQEDLVDTVSTPHGIRIVKLHGSASDVDSLAFTLQHVAGEDYLAARDETIRLLFAEGDHEAILVLGYSCSDLFDITPAITRLGTSCKPVYFVDHSETEPRAEAIAVKQCKNPFRICDGGVRLVCNTRRLLEQLSEATVGTQPELPAPPAAHPWRLSVQRWWQRISESDRMTVGHRILGQLWYRCADYRASKAHYRAVLATTAPRFVIGTPHTLYEGLVFPRPTVAPEIRANALALVGGCHRALSEYKQALERFREAAHLAQSSGLRELEAMTTGSQGTVLFNLGEVREAISLHKRSVALWAGDESRLRGLGAALANLGNAYGADGQFERAAECFEKGIAIARRLGDKVGEGSRLGGLGVVRLRQGDLAAGDACHQESLQIAADLGDSSGVAHQKGGLAAVAADRGDFERAIGLGMEAVALFEELGDQQGVARGLGNLARYLIASGSVLAGIAPMIRSLEMAVAIGDTAVMKNSLVTLEKFIAGCEAAGAPASNVTRTRALLHACQSKDMSAAQPLQSLLNQLVESVPVSE